MYVPYTDAVSDPQELRIILNSLRLGCLVTHDTEGLFASHLPFLYNEVEQTLTGHLARKNPHRGRAGETAALAVFQGINAYISPSLYPSLLEHGRVAPTWNYEAVHIGGRLSWREDPHWLAGHLTALTNKFEAGREKPWRVSDAPADYLNQLLCGVVGLELKIETVEAKRKLSQGCNRADRLGVIAGLSLSGTAADLEVAAAMHALMSF